MDVMPWQAVVFISIPEAFLIMLMGFSLIGIRPDIKKLGVVAVIQALASYFIRALPYPFGIHMVLQLLMMLVLVKLILKHTWRSILPGVLIGYSIFAGVIDTLYIPLIIKKVPLEVILANPYVRVAVSIPQQLIMLFIILLCYKFKFSIIDMSTYEEGM